jgi:hypothetical protein
LLCLSALPLIPALYRVASAEAGNAAV